MEDTLRVLVVDDTVTYRKIATDILSDLPGVSVIGSAANGKLALEKIEQLAPDLLLLDLEMPELDGLGVLKNIRDHKRNVGAIMFSAVTTAGAQATIAALELGAFDFVPKPTGLSRDENILQLKTELKYKLAAYSRAVDIQRILHRRNYAKPTPAMPSIGAAPVKTGVTTPMKQVVPKGHPQVVAIGISTGGPQSLTTMLPKLPGDLAVPILIVQHMPPIFTKSLADDLNNRCKLHVVEASEGMAVRKGDVLIAPGGKHMMIERKENDVVVRITDDPPEHSCRPSVDYLFRSVAGVYGPDAVGIIMTGMGNDGTSGSEMMKNRGATILAQNEATCVVYGMPREPIERGIADAALPLDAIAGEITKLVGQGGRVCK